MTDFPKAMREVLTLSPGLPDVAQSPAADGAEKFMNLRRTRVEAALPGRREAAPGRRGIENARTDHVCSLAGGAPSTPSDGRLERDEPDGGESSGSLHRSREGVRRARQPAPERRT
jgi:hypothetical protein